VHNIFNNQHTKRVFHVFDLGLGFTQWPFEINPNRENMRNESKNSANAA